MLSGHLGELHVNFRTGQVTFHSALLNGQESRQVVCQLHKKKKLRLAQGKQAKFRSCLSKGQSGIQVFFKPCIVLSTAYLCFYKFFKRYFLFDFFFLFLFQHKAWRKCMPVDTFWAIRAAPEPAIKSLLNSFQKEFTNLK